MECKILQRLCTVDLLYKTVNNSFSAHVENARRNAKRNFTRFLLLLLCLDIYSNLLL